MYKLQDKTCGVCPPALLLLHGEGSYNDGCWKALRCAIWGHLSKLFKNNSINKPFTTTASLSASFPSVFISCHGCQLESSLQIAHTCLEPRYFHLLQSLDQLLFTWQLLRARRCNNTKKMGKFSADIRKIHATLVWKRMQQSALAKSRNNPGAAAFSPASRIACYNSPRSSPTLWTLLFIGMILKCSSFEFLSRFWSSCFLFFFPMGNLRHSLWRT